MTTTTQRISLLGKVRRHIYIEVLETRQIRRFTRGQLSFFLSNNSYVIDDFMNAKF